MSIARILVVDDHPLNLKLVANVLEAEGYEVIQAVDAETAEVEVQRQPPDLILMDIALPGMDGLTLTRKLKGAAATQHIVIAALTAFAMKGDSDRAQAAGCNAYITKPIDTRTLPATIATLLSQRVSSNTPPS